MKYWLMICAVAFVAAGTAGCGRGTKHDIVPVQGTLAFSDGARLPAGTQLLFSPSEGGVGTAVGITTENGSFEVTHVSGSKGAEEAKYTVQLRAPEGQEATFYKLLPRDVYDPGVLVADVRRAMPPLTLVVRKAKS